MKVRDLISTLQQFNPNLRVVDDFMMDIETVEETTWVDSNFPYDRPDEKVVRLS